jgi:hypothetical protein
MIRMNQGFRPSIAFREGTGSDESIKTGVAFAWFASMVQLVRTIAGNKRANRIRARKRKFVPTKSRSENNIMLTSFSRTRDRTTASTARRLRRKRSKRSEELRRRSNSIDATRPPGRNCTWIYGKGEEKNRNCQTTLGNRVITAELVICDFTDILS